MEAAQIVKRYPTLCKVAEHGQFVSDLNAAAKAAEASTDRRTLWDAYQSNAFRANELTFWLCIHEFGDWPDGTADEIERHLLKVVTMCGLDQARTAFRAKLLVNDKGTFTDVRYEIAAAAGAVDFFDRGTVKLEEGIGGAKKNSDIKGSRQGAPTRMEVRVVHDDWPPRLNSALEDVMRGADVPAGYTVQLRFLPDAASAAQVKALVEAVHQVHEAGPPEIGVPVVVHGVTFYVESPGGGYESPDKVSPISSLNFEDEQEDRLISTPVFTRSMIDPQEREFFENPKEAGVMVFGREMVDKRVYKDQPFSTKIGQAIEGKARQCETGVCNIVVLGTPSPMVDHDVDDSVKGALAATYVKEADGSFQSAGPLRKPSGMFVPTQHSENVDNLVKPFEIISGVWHVRLGGSAPQSRVILNPNAAVPMSAQDASVLERTLPRPS